MPMEKSTSDVGGKSHAELLCVRTSTPPKPSGVEGAGPMQAAATSAPDTVHEEDTGARARKVSVSIFRVSGRPAHFRPPRLRIKNAQSSVEYVKEQEEEVLYVRRITLPSDWLAIESPTAESRGPVGHARICIR